MPCRNCEDRHVGCHGTCERYIDWKEKHIESKRKRFEQKQTDYQYMAVASIRKAKRLHKKKYE